MTSLNNIDYSSPAFIIGVVVVVVLIAALTPLVSEMMNGLLVAVSNVV